MIYHCILLLAFLSLLGAENGDNSTTLTGSTTSTPTTGKTHSSATNTTSSTSTSTHSPHTTSTMQFSTATPAPGSINYIIFGKTNACLALEFDLELGINYLNKADKEKSMTFHPGRWKVDNRSRCEKSKNVAVLKWSPAGAVTDWELTLEFSETGKDEAKFYQLSLMNMIIPMDSDVFTDIKKPGTRNVSSSEPLFKTAVGYHYYCKSNQTYSLPKPSVPENTVTLKFANVTLEAMMHSKDGNFSTNVHQCFADLTPDNRVPMAVGITLLVFTLAALVAFIVLSRRRRRNAYSSM